jgi:hypothetical protein
MGHGSGSEAIVRALLSEGRIRYSEAHSCKGLTVFPLFVPETPSGRAYVLFADALRAGDVLVEEVRGGVVSRLVVHNRGDRAVLLVDGEQLVGVKQNRMVNTTILVAARTRLEIPVACVEQKRWAPSRVDLVPADTLYPAARVVAAEAVTEAVRARGVHEADQTGLWESIASKLRDVGASSRTSAAYDAYLQRASDLEAYVRALPPAPGQCGVACALNGSVVCLDLFDHPETLHALYPRLIRSYALDALMAWDRSTDPAELDRFLAEARTGRATVHPAVGEGEEVRLTSPQVVGAALVAGGRAVHLALFRRPTVVYSDTGLAPSQRRRRIS